jgi:hypothetical protein
LHNSILATSICRNTALDCYDIAILSFGVFVA